MKQAWRKIDGKRYRLYYTHPERKVIESFKAKLKLKKFKTRIIKDKHFYSLYSDKCEEFIEK